MNIIITKRFSNRYLKTLNKNFSKTDFINILKSKNHIFISLHNPYFKLKCNISSISVRGILIVLDDENIVPLMIFLKKDKKNGENLNWKDYKDMILEEQELSLKDIENGDYEIY